jgi:mono/diheme cytochrome c family protein
MRIGLLVKTIALFAGLGAAAFYALTIPAKPPGEALPSRQPDFTNGETMFNIGGCASCHATPRQDDRLQLGGGLALKSPFGTFNVPNISQDRKNGIGAWTESQFAHAMLGGVGRNGEHLYPSFPYPSYQRMAVDDVRDLFAFLKTLPAIEAPSQPHELPFPFNVRRAVGAWKLLFLHRKPFEPDPGRDAAYNRGAYLVEGPGHCAECHSSRNLLGAIRPAGRFAGGLNPAGEGWVPNITPHADGLAAWSEKDWEFFFESGLTPEGYAVEGDMAAVIANVSRLTAEDRRAMAVYLKALPPRPGRKPAKS